jgi:hypothetical protein
MNMAGYRLGGPGIWIGFLAQLSLFTTRFRLVLGPADPVQQQLWRGLRVKLTTPSYVVTTFACTFIEIRLGV